MPKSILISLFALWALLSGCSSGVSVPARFHDVGLLSEGDPVFDAGVKIGKVDQIELVGTGPVVSVNIREDRHIYIDDTLQIQHAGAFGERRLLLIHGRSRIEWRMGDTICGVY